MIGLLAIAAAAVLVVGGMSAAGSDRKTDRTATTLQLVARVTSFNLVDNPPTEKASGGDMSARTDDQFTPSGKRAGRDQVFCVAVNATGDAECVATAFLEGGQVTATFAFDSDTGAGSGAITGGTGAYETAGGSVTIQERPDTTAHYTLRIITLN